MSKCEMCIDVVAKYTCPRCNRKTCSLQCVKKHKETENCDGIRNKTKFVSMKTFSDINLLNDYRFLEEAGRIADNPKRDPKRNRNYNNSFTNQLRKAALVKNTQIKFLPYPMTRRKTNTTTLSNHRSGHILWHLELVFPQAEAKYVATKVNEHATLSDILKDYIHPTESDPVKRQKLKNYCYHGIESCAVLMKVEGRSANDVMYHEMDCNKTLQDNLSGKELIEYPILLIVLPSHTHLYPIQNVDAESKTSSQQNNDTTSLQHTGKESVH